MLYWIGGGELNEYESYSVLADEKNIYVGTSGNSLLRLTLKDAKYTKQSFTVKNYNTKNYYTLNGLVKTRTGEIWFGANNGASYFDANMKLHEEGSDDNSFITDVTEDYEGNIWLASSKDGVYRIQNGKYCWLENKIPLSHKSVNSITKLKDKIYVGTDEGLYIVDEKWNNYENKLTNKLKDIRVRNLSKDTYGNVWISTYSDYGLIKYSTKNEKIDYFTVKNGLPSNRVRSTYALTENNMAVATTDGLSIIKDDKVVRTYISGSELLNTNILSMVQYHDKLYIGSDGSGIYAIDEKGTSQVGNKEGLTSTVILRMVYDEKSDGVFISAGSKIYFMKDDKVSELTAFKNGVGSVFDIVLIGDNIGIVKSDGIWIISREDLLNNNEGSSIKNYGIKDGLTSDIVANSWHYRDGNKLYFCTSKGVSILDMDNLAINSVEPKFAINKIIVTKDDGTEVTYRNPSEINLKNKDKRIFIEFAVLSYSTCSSQVEYWMEGFEKEGKTVDVKKLIM